MSHIHHTLKALTRGTVFLTLFSQSHLINLLTCTLFAVFYYLAEVYDNKSNIIYSLKQLKSKSVTLSASNLEDSETLVGTADGRRPATIIYTSGSTGTPKGNEISNRLRAAPPPSYKFRHFKVISFQNI